MYFYGLNLGLPGAGPSSNLGPSFEQTWPRITRQCYIQNSKHLNQVVLKKKMLEHFSMYFYGLNLGPSGRDHLGAGDLHLNKLEKKLLGNATY